MCTQSTAKRRRTQASHGFRHLAPRERPNYKKAGGYGSSIQDAIQRERQKALRMASSSKKK